MSTFLVNYMYGILIKFILTRYFMLTLPPKNTFKGGYFSFLNILNNQKNHNV